MPALLAANILHAPPVLNFIEELTVSGDIKSAPRTEFRTHLATAFIAASKIKADVNVQETSKHTPPLSIIGKGLVYTSLPKGSSRPDDFDKDRKLYHRLGCLPDITCTNSQDARELCRSVLSEDSALDNVRRLNSRTRYITIRTLATIRPEEEEHMLPHQQMQLRWMRKYTAKDNQEVTPESVNHLGADGEMLERIGVHLIDILKGRLDPLTIIIEDDLLYRYYTNKALSRYIDQAAEFVRILCQKKPAMKILEIGAGTGSTTIPILKAATGLLNRYVFTDISAGFFEKVKGLLEPWRDAPDFQKLDTERPVSEQGFDESGYDLIVACNVLHATGTMSNTMSNVRKLLKPDGKLCLVEVTRPSLFVGLIFGTLPGWWLGAAGDGRVDSPLLSVEEWDATLKANGFSGTDLWLPDYPIDQGQQYSAIVSTAVNADRQYQLPSLELIYIGRLDWDSDIPGVNGHLFAREIARHFGVIAKDLDVHETTLKDVKPKDTVYIVLLEMVQPFLSTCDETEFEQIKSLFSLAKGIIWVTTGGAMECQKPLNAVITGLARSTRSENRSTRLTTVDFDLAQESPESMASKLLKLVACAFAECNDAANMEFEYAVRDGRILIPRLVVDENLNETLGAGHDNQAPRMERFFQDDRTLALRIGTPGLIETMAWADEPLIQTLADDEIRVELRYGAINFRDLMLALGQLENISSMARECSGVVVEVGSTARLSFQIGDRVCAVGGGAYASSSVVKIQNAYRIPDTMPLDVAASIPIAYTTAYYTLKTVANLQAGESVLIHLAAGALGQAAVMIAQHLRAEIYITVGSLKKKSFMMTNFHIPEQHTFSSRLTGFSRGIKRLTGGKGVDVVLNSLAADTVRESLACIAKFGRFMEVGKQDAAMNSRLNMDIFGRHVMFAAVDLAFIWAEKPLLFQSLLGSVAELVETGALGRIKPIESAFRLMQTGKHMGKVLLKQIQLLRFFLVRLHSPNFARMVGTLWLEELEVLDERLSAGWPPWGQEISLPFLDLAGLAKIRSNCPKIWRRSASTYLLKAWTLQVFHNCKIRDLTGGKPVSGIIQGAMILNDALVNTMSYKQWRDTLIPKVQGTQNLYDVLGGSLDFFIMLSSGTGLIGSYGQCNYAAGNTFQDAFARHMSSQGHPVRSLDLPGIADAGYIANHAGSIAFLERQGLRVLKLEKLIALLNQAVKEPFSPSVSQSQISLGLSSHEIQDGNRRSDGKFSHLHARQSYRTGSTTKKGTMDISKALTEAQSVKQAVALVCERMIGKVAELLALPVEDLSQSQSISA
ncbi:MAG: hypothetical protein Q9200_000633 [Gallowayella weberi]